MARSRRDRKRKKTIVPGVEVRSGHRGANISFGIPGERVTIGTSGRVTTTHGYRTSWDQAFDPLNSPIPGLPGGVTGKIEAVGPPPEEGWLNALPKPAEEPVDPHFQAALDDLDTVDPTQPEDYLPDRGPIRREAEGIVDMHDPTSPED
ncbi:DUF4236 domain-containing protein [Stomatohabitans albus]|uniref:DUF4236 domain-containing protein n=1 Tax=Stomatohabitans albus TaxID=3110766 RepID=UPI00300CAAE5